MKKNKLTVLCLDESIYLNKDLLPQPAYKYIPDWFKNISIDYTKDKNKPIKSMLEKPLTVKSCPSFVDIFKEGYIIPAPVDYYISLDNERWEWKTSINYNTLYNTGEVKYHGDLQFVDHLPPQSNIKSVFKIVLPYTIFGPKDYYLKILPVPYAFNKDYHSNYGTQNLNNTYELNIQMNYTSNKKEILIKRHEPLALIIPYKKEKIDLEYDFIDNRNDLRKKLIAQKFGRIGVFKNRYYKSL